MLEMIPLEDALNIVLEHVTPVEIETIGLSEAMGRVLAQDIIASINQPPFDRSPLDGYALRAQDIILASKDLPVELWVMREIPAGQWSSEAVKNGEAVKILTGAPIPPGADVVIRFEDIVKTEAGIKVFQPLLSYANYCFAGEDIKCGETVLSRGTELGPAGIGVLAGLGINSVKVYRAPRIGVLSTGSELINISEELEQGKIYNSNMYALAALIQQTGAKPVAAGTVADISGLTADGINGILSDNDMVVTTGGVSVGDYDVVKDALQMIGAQILFWRVNKRPGTPVLCAVKDGKLILCLSGNPAAAVVSFHLLARPAIRKLQGLNNCLMEKTTAVLEEDFLKKSSQRRFLRGYVFTDQGMLKAKLTGAQTPGVMKSMLGCNALIDVPAGSGVLNVGDIVNVLLLH